jgi:aminoglycoside phosphotransferase
LRSVSDMDINFSEKLREHLSRCSLVENQIGLSGSTVYQITNWNEKSAYLKIAPTIWHMTLRPELNALEWLQNRFPVPQLLYYEEYNGLDFLITSELTGLDASKDLLLSNPNELVGIYARGIKELHKLDIQNCPLNQTLSVRLQDAGRRVMEGIADEFNVEEENKHRTPLDILNELLISQPVHEDLVFTHGDYCLPNLIIDNSQVSGMIDLGKAGIADRYQDISLAIRSLRHNYKTDMYKDLFLECYGMNELDEHKLKYYILLDELF